MPISFNNNLMALGVSNNLESHYARLSVSVQRLSSGLRINSAADDAAGLAIRELMRSDVAALNQGMRNANDAISMIQVADGALGVIDEKLIRMKELAEQAATGTYNSTQRLMIDSEFQAMASEIERIARATDFNGIKLLDGSLQGEHDGSGLNATGKLKVHFGSANDSAEDYYYVEIGDCTLAGLGLREPVATNTISTIAATNVTNSANVKTQSNVSNQSRLDELVSNGGTKIFDGSTHGHNLAIAYIPKGTKNLYIELDDAGGPDGFQIFTTSGKHIAGTIISDPNGEWYTQFHGETGNRRNPTVADMNAWAITPANGFNDDATYDGTQLNGTGNDVAAYNGVPPYNSFTIEGMNIGFSGEGNHASWNDPRIDYLTIDETTEDLIFCITGDGPCSFTATWTYMPADAPPDPGPGPDPGPNPPQPDKPTPSPQGDIISIKTQEKAQKALERIDDAIVAKDKVRANLGATQNRLENTVTNLTIMAENMLSAESRISDADIGAEMMVFVKNQILTQSSVAMLSQANSWPHMLMSLIGG